MARKAKPKATDRPSYLAVIENDAAADIHAVSGSERRSPDLDCLAYPSSLAKVDGAEHALKAWDTINEHLVRMRVISAVDVIQLELLCAAVGRWHWCQERYRELGPDGITPKGRYYKVSGRNGTQFKTRPEVQDEREAIRVIASIGSSFGLDPVARQRLLSGNLSEPDEEDLFAET